MTTCTRQDVLTVLQRDWAEYVQRFRRLSPEAQSAFLDQQGYARFADLLAHIIAWWEVGYRSVERYAEDPASQPVQYNVDVFNAEAVAAVSGQDEDQVIVSFEKMRRFLIEFVEGLPDTAFENEKVVDQFDMELIGHLNEHRIPQTELSM